jgi:hypothetical protein
VAGVASGDASAAVVAVGRGVGEGGGVDVAVGCAAASGLVNVFAVNAGAICVTGIARAAGRGAHALSAETDAQTMQHIRVPVAVLRDVV